MTTQARRSSAPLACAIFSGLVLCCRAAEAQPADADHLWWEDDLVSHVLPQDNVYATGPSYVTWAGFAGATVYSNRSLCTTFLTAVLQQAYGWTSSDFRAWMGSTSPTAAKYHDAIEALNGFSRITLASDISPGDILALKYQEGGTVTGHVATAASQAAPRAATSPIVVGTSQYEITVIDSSSSGHGPTDTRLLPNGTWHQGAGRGVMRLYGDSNGNIVGYSWSTVSASTFYPLSTRHLVIGRLL